MPTNESFALVMRALARWRSRRPRRRAMRMSAAWLAVVLPIYQQSSQHSSAAVAERITEQQSALLCIHSPRATSGVLGEALSCDAPAAASLRVRALTGVERAVQGGGERMDRSPHPGSLGFASSLHGDEPSLASLRAARSIGVRRRALHIARRRAPPFRRKVRPPAAAEASSLSAAAATSTLPPCARLGSEPVARSKQQQQPIARP